MRRAVPMVCAVERQLWAVRASPMALAKLAPISRARFIVTRFQKKSVEVTSSHRSHVISRQPPAVRYARLR